MSYKNRNAFPLTTIKLKYNIDTVTAYKCIKMKPNCFN